MKRQKPTNKFSLVQKLVASYAAITFFTMAALVFSILGLYSLNKTARDIARNDLMLINSANKLRESLLAQERYSGKYAILKSPEFIDLYRLRETEFLSTLKSLHTEQQKHELENLASLFENYRRIVNDLFLGKISDTLAQKTAAENVLKSIDTIYTNGQRNLNAKLEEADRKESSTIRWTLLLSFTGFILAICVAALFIYTISSAIGKLKKATHRIAEGDFDYDPQIPAGDEIGDLARDFSTMAVRLKELEQMNLDASPLTRLPGNIAIERVLSKRLHEGYPFAVCYADLDNFKAYNDRYGYIKASEIIKITGDLIYGAVTNYAEKDAFVGHVGGDDFVMLVAADKAATVCEAVIDAFDKEIISHYSSEDLARGAIEGTDRYGVERVFPIMTISIAVVICRQGEFDSAVEIAKTAAEIKDHVKGMPASNYFINRRKTKRDATVSSIGSHAVPN